MLSPQVARFVSVLILSLLLLGDTPNGVPFGNRKRGNLSVFSLFNLREKSRFWSDSVIRTGFNDLETSDPGKLNSFNYTKAGNIASYLKLLEVDSIYIPVPVNFIFVGFEGKGNKEFELNSEELERWFTKIDHIFEHSRIPQTGEILTPFYKISVDREQRHHLPLLSHINYNFSVHAIQTGEKVTTIFERAIEVLGRRDDVSDSGDSKGLWQVDVDMMDIIFTSLVDYLQLGDAYNIFVLNPKRNAKIAKYGYRRGLSDTEIMFLNENKALQEKILQSGSVPESVLALDKITRPLYQKHPMAKFSWAIMDETDTIEWHNRCLDALNNVEKLHEGKDTENIIQSKVLQFLQGKNDDLKLFLERTLKNGEFGGLHAECLTDTWIGNHRWAFIDLTAGPFTWGPSVGGEGVRIEQSLPNVDKTIGAITEISEDEAEDLLQEAIQDKFAVLGDVSL